MRRIGDFSVRDLLTAFTGRVSGVFSTTPFSAEWPGSGISALAEAAG